MALPFAGTFAYVAIVPDTIDDGAFKCAARTSDVEPKPGNRLFDARLVGSTPTLRVSDASLTSPEYGGRPEAMRSRVKLTASMFDRSTVKTFSFFVSKRLTLRLAAGDVIHLARTCCGGLGLSVLRSGELVVAAGAITHVPLGTGVVARTPTDLIAQATAVFHERDPEFEFPEPPLEIAVGNRSAILFTWRRELGPFDVEVIHGFRQGLPGKDECAAIARREMCSIYAAVMSAGWLREHPWASSEDS